jgi:GNAT superfamily N-acetyltransferase
MNNYNVQTYRERPELREKLDWKYAVWPEFMLHDNVSDPIWHRLFDYFPDYQLFLTDEADQFIGIGHSVPFHWDGTYDGLPSGWDGVFSLAVEQHEQGIAPNAVSAIEAAIHPDRHGNGVSYHIIEAMRAKVRDSGWDTLVAPVRPNRKSDYPLTPMENYIKWQRADGTPFDPWLRVHWRVGAEIVKVAERSMVIDHPVAKWEKWAEMQFPESGQYIVPGALNPVEVNREEDWAKYIEPNVWMVHKVAG